MEDTKWQLLTCYFYCKYLGIKVLKILFFEETNTYEETYICRGPF